MERSVNYPNPASLSGGKIVIYDTYFSRSEQAAILAHELGHELFINLSEEDKKDYKSTMNWIEGKTKSGPFRFRRRDGFVRENSMLNPEEDFADNIRFYVFDRARLKSKVPHAFEWIKNHFGDSLTLGGSCGSS